MVSLDNLEFSYHDETLSRMGISPSEIDLVIPKFVTRDRVEEIEYWTEQMTQAVGKMELSEREVREPHLLQIFHPPPNIFFTGRSALFLRQKLMKWRIAGSEERVSLSPTTMQHLLARVRETLMRLEQETSSYSFEISGQIFKCTPGLAEEAHRPVGVRADQTQDDELLLAALVAVHGPHLHVLER